MNEGALRSLRYVAVSFGSWLIPLLVLFVSRRVPTGHPLAAWATGVSHELGWRLVGGVALVVAGARIWSRTVDELESVGSDGGRAVFSVFERHWGGLGSDVRGLVAPAPALLRLFVAAALWLLGLCVLVLGDGKASADAPSASTDTSPAPSSSCSAKTAAPEL